jgi:hypothetical protein
LCNKDVMELKFIQSIIPIIGANKENLVWPHAP